MEADWLSEACKIPDEGRNYLRRLAVRAVAEKHYSAEFLADIFGISRSSRYDWWRWYRAGGEAALETPTAPGAPAVITPIMEWWLAQTVLKSTPVDPGYDPVLWTRAILAALLKKPFGVCVSESTVGLHLHPLALSWQTPGDHALEPAHAKVAPFLETTFPKIQRLAERMGADIGFEEEAGVGIRTRSGRTWGAVGQPPEVAVSDRRGGDTVLSLSTATGELRDALEEQDSQGDRYVEFLQLIRPGRPRPLRIITEQASFHNSTVVRDFVRAHRTQLRLFFFPTPSPALKPDEQV